MGFHTHGLVSVSRILHKSDFITKETHCNVENHTISAFSSNYHRILAVYDVSADGFR
ncbi:hypothetical protein LCGC14_3012690, partial [marine sediment metagenome]